jgi:hypothetical protein
VLTRTADALGVRGALKLRKLRLNLVLAHGGVDDARADIRAENLPYRLDKRFYGLPLRERVEIVRNIRELHALRSKRRWGVRAAARLVDGQRRGACHPMASFDISPRLVDPVARRVRRQRDNPLVEPFRAVVVARVVHGTAVNVGAARSREQQGRARLGHELHSKLLHLPSHVRYLNVFERIAVELVVLRRVSVERRIPHAPLQRLLARRFRSVDPCSAHAVLLRRHSRHYLGGNHVHGGHRVLLTVVGKLVHKTLELAHLRNGVEDGDARARRKLLIVVARDVDIGSVVKRLGGGCPRQP